MVHLTTPTDKDIARLFADRSDACVTLYLHTTPTPDGGASRIEFANLVRDALAEVDRLDLLDPRRRDDLVERLDEVRADEELWRHRANTLAVFASPTRVATFRLANRLEPRMTVGDRFDVKPLLRATTFDHAAFVVALSERRVRLVEIFADQPPEEIELAEVPAASDGAEARPRTRLAGKGDRSDPGEARARDRERWCRRVDAALAPVLRGTRIPVIVMAAQPIASVFHGLCTAEHLVPRIVRRNPDRLTPARIAAEARPVLREHYDGLVADLHEHFDRRLARRRTSEDLADVARAATEGAVETLFVDIESEATGTIDEHTGAVDRSPDDGPAYRLAGEITRRALATGAKVVALRRADMPGGAGEIAATLRFARPRPRRAR